MAVGPARCIITDSDHVSLLSAVQPETVANRLGSSDYDEDEDEDEDE